MPLQRATTLYPVNSTTVDTGTGIDVRLLSDVEAGATDTSQSVQNPTKNTTSERTFDPANANVTAVNNAQTTLAKLGYAFSTTDMGVADTSACVAYLGAQTCTVAWTGAATGTGSALGNDVFTPKASLWKYNTSTDTGTLIVGGAGTAITISAVLAYTNTAYSASVSLSVPATTFATNEVLYLQMGGSVQCANALGAHTTTWRLDVDISTTVMTLATVGLINTCSYSNSLNSTATPSSNRLIAPIPYSASATGAASYTKLANVAKTFSLAALGAASRTGLLVISLPRNLIATASTAYARQVAALRNFTLNASGTVTNNQAISLGRIATGIGTVTYLKQVTASKSFTLTGVGTPYYSKFTIANREFTVVGQGKIVMTGPNASTIAMPIDDIPDGGAPSATYIFPVLD